MAGIIKRDVVEEVRQKTDIKNVVEQTVTLKPAGIGTWKGLCPFHEEKTPSFTVKPSTGFYHCFGCGEGGDVFKFLMESEHLSFTETVEDLAAKAGITVEYEEGGNNPDQQTRGARQAVLKVNKAAMEYFQSQLNSPEAQTARNFLMQRGFDKNFCEEYSIGYAPQGWTNLLSYLRKNGFNDEDIKTAVLVSNGNKGLYDRFRGRLMWPIKDVTGQVLGFGARKLYDDDPGGKYINSSETPAYKKSQVLYGLDKAKKAIAETKEVVVVEGYTDVMACHAAGINNAVATCGTAFGKEHIQVMRRLMNDDLNSEVIFTFDGDEAGRNAALKAFELDQSFLAKTSVAVDPDGLDPCDIRLKKGDQGLQELLENRKPLFEFALRTVFAQFDTKTAEHRVNALKALAPVLNKIKDPYIRPTYVREVAGWLGIDQDRVNQEMDASARGKQEPYRQEAAESESENPVENSHFIRPDPHDPIARVEREVLETVVQFPQVLTDGENQEYFLTSIFETPAYDEVAQAIRKSLLDNSSGKGWTESISQNVPPELVPLVAELSMATIPVTSESKLTAHAEEKLKRLVEIELDRARAIATMELSQLGDKGDPERTKVLLQELLDIEKQQRELRKG